MRKEIWAKEFERQKVDFEKWSLNEANNEYNLCPTYPKYLLFPKDMTEEGFILLLIIIKKIFFISFFY